jgi:predicted GNAT superfamily acetyltransferase
VSSGRYSVVLCVPGAGVSFVLVCREFPAPPDSSLSLWFPEAPTTFVWDDRVARYIARDARGTNR